MGKAIKVRGKGAALVPYTKLQPFQGELKDLTEENYQKLKAQIAENGFKEPIAVWKHDGKYFILNGHQRLRAVKTMVEQEGFTCPPLPVSLVEAKTMHEAKATVLAFASQFGTLNRQGLYEYMAENNISFEDMQGACVFPELNFESFQQEFFVDPAGASDGASPTNPGGHFGDEFKGEKLLNYLDKETCRMLFTFSKEDYDAVVTLLESFQAKHKAKDLAQALVLEAKSKGKK